MAGLLERAKKFVTDGDDIRTDISDCGTCKHLYKDGVSCVAFQQGIPDRILVGWESHRGPVEGDNGIQYERK